jgi:hypothetical protein
MKRWVILLIVGTGALAFAFWVNTWYKMIDLSSLDVRVGDDMSVDSVKVVRGFYSIDRANDLELFQDNVGDRTVYDGRQIGPLDTDYGENDFLIVYADRYYFQFRHWIFNSNNQHDYRFQLDGGVSAPSLTVKIDGPDDMHFSRTMSRISDAGHLLCNGPIDRTKVNYNMIEFE